MKRFQSFFLESRLIFLDTEIMESLISMTDFVDRINQSRFFIDKNGDYPNINTAIEPKEATSLSECFRTIVKYKDFLKQPLTLGMFVPCDLEGNVLEEPNRSMHTDSECEEYQQAKERCLFEIDGDYFFEQSNMFYIIDFLSEGINRLLIYKDKLKEYNTIESLAGHKRLKLTATALKQIGL